ncbi:MAG: sulfatase [Chloroflexota bacterium]|nr:MAG: sulfatase [Chloroflexota bacterium]
MNVILVLLDSLRADHVGCYGYGPTAEGWTCQTPAIDRLAGESIRFTRAFPEALPTIPVRRAVHTGRRTYPFRDWRPQKGDTVRAYGWQRIPEEHVTLAETLQANGYTTAFITDAFHQFKPSMNFHRGFDHWQWIRGQERDPIGPAVAVSDAEVDRHMTAKITSDGLRQLVRQYLANARSRRHEEDFQAPKVFTAAMRWVEQIRGTGRPFFLAVDSFDPHEPWDPPAYYTDLYNPGYQGISVINPQYGPSDYLTADELRQMRALYAGEVTMTDRWLGYFIDHVRATGLLDDTILIVTSDHGHQLGEHGLTGKISWGMHPELMDVPLIVRMPGGASANTTCDGFTQTHDFAPTILGGLGLTPAEAMEGIDVLAMARGAAPRREYVTCGFNNYVWCRDNRWVYIARNDGGEATLFDIVADPDHRHDVASGEPEVVADMRRRVVQDAGGEPLPVYDQQSMMAREWYRLP